MTIFWDIPKWNRRQTKWDGGSIKINELYMVKKMENGNTISIFFNKGERGIK